jgi:hypothetical protein
MINPESSNNPKRFWSFIKSKKTELTGIASLKGDHGTQQTDSKIKANILNTQVSSVFI